MNSKHQKLVMAVAGAACAAVWAPQVLRGVGSAPSSAQVDAGPTPEEMAAMTAGLVVEPGAAPSAPSGASGGAAGSDAGTSRPSKPNLAPKPGEDARIGLAEVLAGLQNFGATAKPRSLDDIASDWARARSRSAGTVPTEAGILPAPLRPDDVEGESLEVFLAANPFRGTLVFADDALALFGPTAFRVGDELLGGDVVVARIEGQRVTLSQRGIPREIHLPPLRAGEARAAGAAPAAASGGSVSRSSSSSTMPVGQEDLNPTVVAPVPGGAN